MLNWTFLYKYWFTFTLKVVPACDCPTVGFARRSDEGQLSMPCPCQFLVQQDALSLRLHVKRPALILERTKGQY